MSVIVAALAAGLAALERKALFQAQLSRPIVLAPILGWILGDPLGGLAIGAPLELLWIGAANLGAALPQHETAAAAAIATAAVVAGNSLGSGIDGSIALLAFLLFAPVALLGRKLEGIAERANERLVARAAVGLAEGLVPDRALRLHLVGVWRPLAATGALVIFAGFAVGPLLAWVHERLPGLIREGAGIGWALLWAVGGAAAVRAARLPRGLALAAGGAAAVIVLAALARGL